MNKVTSGLVDRVKQSRKETPLQVSIEKAMYNPTGSRAKVLFGLSTTNRSRTEAFFSDQDVVEEAFFQILKGNASLIPSSVTEAGIDGKFFGILEMNTQSMSEEAAAKANLTKVSASMYLDADDDVWTVISNDDEDEGSVLIKKSSDSLEDILALRLSTTTASAKVDMSASVSPGDYVALVHPVRNRRVAGFALDSNTIFCPEYASTVTFSGCDVVAAVEATEESTAIIDKAYGDDSQGTFSELAAADKQAVKEYLSKLFGHSPAFLSAYHAAIDKFFVA